MEYYQEKVDQAVLALLWLNTYEDPTTGKRAWKGQNWDALERLHKQGLIGNPVGKAKSVTLSEEGAKRSRELFRKLFGKESPAEGG